MSKINKTNGLFYEDLLLEVAIEKCSGDVELSQLQIVDCYYREYGPNAIRAYNVEISFEEVNVGSFRVSLCNKLTLMTGDGAIDVILSL